MTRNIKMIFKTHLDMGFTDMEANVVDRYMEKLIPSALDTVEYFKEKGGSFRYRWTLATWLICEYLRRNKGKKRKAFEQALSAGDICWHALPFTSHSELADLSIFKHGLSLSRRLDQEFGKKTIAAKLTDVPGHTRGIIAPLAEAGIKLLHIGINPASAFPEVPPIFRWQDSHKNELIVIYHKDYGEALKIGGTEFMISMTGDNHGPHKPENVEAILASLKGAKVSGSDLNELAESAIKIQDSLPLLCSEIGDSWIHGIGTDPRKTAEFKELCRLRNKWPKFSEKDVFSTKLMTIFEHTWGLDEKRYFPDPSSWTATELQSPAAQKFASSWDEKRKIITDSIALLPPAKAKEAQKALKVLRPSQKINADETSQTSFENKFFKLSFDKNSGAAEKILLKKDSFSFKDSGIFTYQTFDRLDYERFKKQYLRLFVCWARHDFSKPEMPENFPSAVHPGFKCKIKVREDKNALRIFLVSDESIEGFKKLICEYSLPHDRDELLISVKFFGKELLRQPHAAWFSFAVPRKTSVLMTKLGEKIDPADVVSRGARTLHAVENIVIDNKVIIENLDAPLFAPSKMSLLDFHNRIPEADGNFHFNLYNNIWGTNFPMWFNDDMQFRFKLRSLK